MDFARSFNKLASKLGFSTPATKPEGLYTANRDENGAGSIDMIVCQDYEVIPENAKAVGDFLRKKGYKIEVEGVEHKDKLLQLLKKRFKHGQPPPTDIVLDVSGGNGSKAALEAIGYLEKKYPGAPLPTVNFCSCDLGMAIDAACELRRKDARFLASAIDQNELSFLRRTLNGEKKGNYLPVTTTMRELLNGKLGVALEMDKTEDKYYTKQLAEMNSIANNSVLAAWQKGEISPGEAIERMRGYVTGLAESLRSGFYMQDKQDKIDLDADAGFYGAAGFPRKGPVVFSLKDVESTPYGAPKPVLVMRNYDPSVVPMLAEGKLGGLVVTSTYMASHLKLLCETHMVSGLFGMMPQGQKTMRGDFNEEAAPDGPAYYDTDAIEIAGRTVKRGQDILLCLGGNGISFRPPAAIEVKTVDAWTIENDPKIKEDLDNLRKMKKCFAAFFKEEGMKPHGVKANVDTGNSDQMWMVDGIGLVRTEQMVAMDGGMVNDLKSALLEDSDNAYQLLAQRSKAQYRRMMQKLNEDQPVKIRLFDFVHGEILNKEEQKSFLEKYPKLEIHGGEALETWPRLYRDQVAAVFQALRDAKVSTHQPLEVMMPAIRTGQDTAAIKQIVQEEAEKAGVKPHQYSFGVMVETLDSCKNIAQIAPQCDFISFGTNDLTQQYTEMSRADLKAHARYAEKHGFDPFKILAPEILQMVTDVTKQGREANPSLRVDICGGQASDPATALKLFEAGVDNVSVAPNLGNLFGLPMVLGYNMYDAARKPAAPAQKHGQKPASLAEAAKRAQGQAG
ncbi:MAG: hypothetical protein GC185_12065 [Alphaproteobacteria bacterium]|nr:hypothetical protein [Alphaproteobacteria bacterium]